MEGVIVSLYDDAGSPVTRVIGYDTTIICDADTVSTDFSGNSASDNDGSINFD